jgi:hypothetical protein
LELNATVVFDMERDFFSAVDRNGYKWINSKVFEKEMDKVMKKFLKSKNVLSLWSYFTEDGVSKKEKQQRKREVVSFYMNKSKEIIHKNLPKIKSELLKELEKGKNYTNDEVLFNDFEIECGYLVTDYHKADLTNPDTLNAIGQFDVNKIHDDIVNAKELMKKRNIPYCGIIFNKDVAKISPDNPASKFAFDVDMKIFEPHLW